jgi:hypothetical protein
MYLFLKQQINIYSSILGRFIDGVCVPLQCQPAVYPVGGTETAITIVFGVPKIAS